MPARIIQQKRKLVKEPRIELIVKSSCKENSGEGRLKHCRDDIFGAVQSVRSLRPAANSQNNPRRDGARQKKQPKRFAHKGFFGKEAEVDGPRVGEDAGQLKRLGQVLNGIRCEKRRAQRKLNEGADGEKVNPARDGEGHDHDAEQARRHQQHVHLDRHREREPRAAEAPAVLHEVVDGDVGEEHREAIVEAAKHEDGVDALREQQQDAKALWEASESENFHHDERNGEIDSDEETLSEEDVLAVVRDVVKSGVEIDESRGVDEGAGVALELCVVELAAEEALDFLHVGDPVDFGVRDEPDDEAAEHKIDGEKLVDEGSGRASDRVDGIFVVDI